MTSSVSIKKTADRKSFARKAMKASKEEWTGKKVFVKPDIVSFERYPTTTHPEVLREVLRCLTDEDCEVIVGDGPALDAGSSARIIENHSLHEVCGEFHVELCNLHDEPFRKVMTKTGYKLRVSSVPFDFQYLITLPVIKYHRSVKLSGAVKNHFGFLQNRERIMAHTRLKGIHRLIAELHNVFKANLVIMDGVTSLTRAQELRHGGRVLKFGYMFSGNDAVAADSAGLSLLSKAVPELEGIMPKDIGYLRMAEQMGIGSTEFTLKR